MAKLQKLSLSGVRSFSPNPESIQHIKFNDTVTLFLGQNGCGKTTILESIKYALSGELPAGCGSGQGFVNDPSISNKADTKAQIRLRLTDGHGRDIIIIKSMQVSRTSGGAMRFKALDSAIEEVREDGRPHQFSGRMADINSYCSEAMQVSPCILNNVLLCHQENSSWPLEEGKKLKEKFDEIFESTRYNKCIELLRKQYKTYKEKLKVLAIERQTRQENKERVDKLRIKIDDKKEEHEAKSREVERRQCELAPIEARLQEIQVLEDDFGKLEKSLAAKEATRRGIVEQQEALRANISVEFVGTDEELERKITSFENETREAAKTLVDCDRRKAELENKVKETNSRIQTLHSRIGQMKEERRQFEARCVERKSLIEKAKIHLKPESHISDYDIDNNAETVINVLKGALEIQQETLDGKLMAAAADETMLQSAIDKIREEQICIKQNVEGKHQTICENETKIDKLKNDLHDLEVSCSQMKVISTKIENADKDIASVKRSFDEATITNQIEKDKTQISTMEKDKYDLDQEYRLLQKNSVLMEKLENSREIIAQKRSEIKKLNGKHAANFVELFGQTENLPHPLKPAVKSSLDREEKTLIDLQQKLTEKQRQATTLEAKVQHQKEKIRTQESELSSKKRQMRDVCQGRTLEQTLGEVSKKRQSLQNDVVMSSSLRVVYEKFMSQFQSEEPCCPICKTSFKNKAQLVGRIVAALRVEIDAVPSNLPKMKEALQKVEETYNKLQQLKPVNDAIELLSNVTLPALQEELEELQIMQAATTNDLESIRQSTQPCQSKLDICRSLISDAALLDQYQLEIQRCEDTVKDVESQMIPTSSNKSLQETEAELDTLNLDIADLRKKIDSDKLKLDKHKSRLQDLREHRSKLVEKQLGYQQAMQGQPEKEKQLAELTQHVARLRLDINDLNEKLVTVRQELSEAQQKKDALVASNVRAIDECRNKLMANRKTIDDIAKLHGHISTYLDAKKDEAMAHAEKSLSTMQHQEDRIRAAMDNVVQAISMKKEEIAKQETRFRELNDNRSLRDRRKQEHSVGVEIEEIRRQIGSRNLASVRNEKRTLCQRYEEIERDINVTKGQRHQLQTEIGELEADYDKPSNRRAFEEYRDKVYELTILTTAMADLEQYTGLLESAVLEFHRNKMGQINRSVRELWRNIYRGNDIDYIEVKTEEGKGGGIGRRSYNYKVVQVKRGVELEMRGRCSAGQKVLACLVIRMALAEIFSSKCGILALDEPTTNLDRDNILSLSESLSRIVTERREQANFQLLIITHDEEFIDMFTKVQSVTDYYRVQRNDNGNSIVSKEHM